MRISREFINRGKSAAGGWNRKQLEAIGVPWGALRHSGWIDRVIGREIDEASARRFLELRGQKVGESKFAPSRN